MEQLIQRLKELVIEVNLEEKFILDFNNSPIVLPETLHTSYEKNIYLKENLKDELKTNDLKIYYWIVQVWGGIGSFKKNDKNDSKINVFKKQLNDNKMTKETFATISSLSKIASFLNPNSYAIYDARAIYSLNWLLFNFTDRSVLFPQPKGRNSKLAQYDLETIFRLSKRDIRYIGYSKAYFEYCELLKYLSKIIFEEENPYKIEMLLFYIAPEIIIECIKSKTHIKIESNIENMNNLWCKNKTLGSKEKDFLWKLNYDNSVTIIKEFNANDNSGKEYCIQEKEIKQLQQFIFNRKLPLANNVEELNNGTEEEGFGTFLYDDLNWKNATKAQLSSQLASIFIHSDVWEYNGKKRGMIFWLKNENWAEKLQIYYSNHAKTITGLLI